VDEPHFDQGTCVPPAETPDDCAAAGQFLARAAGAPWIWAPIYLDTFTDAAATAYGCTADGLAVMFSFQFLDDENDATARDVTVQTESRLTSPLPKYTAVSFSGAAGHLGSATTVACLNDDETTFAFTFGDATGSDSNALCVSVP
jgi:hypothetical protein